MARINITISLDDGETLDAALAAFKQDGAAGLVAFAGEQGLIDEDPDAGETQRRRRRTKAEIAADNALAAAGGQGSSASATNASTDSAAETLGQQQSSQPSGAGAKVDPFGDQIKEVVAEDAAHVAALAAGAKVIDKGAVSDALSLAIGKIGAPAAKAILVEHGKGESIGRIDPSLYGATHAALVTAAA